MTHEHDSTPWWEAPGGMHKNQDESEQHFIGKQLQWSKTHPPEFGKSTYDHVWVNTPLGQAWIEWKGWKENPVYDVNIGDFHVGTEYDLQDAKDLARKWLESKYSELKDLLGL